MSLQSPWTYEEKDYMENNISISITFNNEDFMLTDPGMTVVRDPGCVYNKINTGFSTYDLPDGEFVIPVEKFTSVEMFTVMDIINSTLYLMK